MNRVPRSTLVICLALWVGFSSVMGVNAAPIAESSTIPTFNTESWPLSVAGVGEGGLVETSSPTLARWHTGPRTTQSGRIDSVSH